MQIDPKKFEAEIKDFFDLTKDVPNIFINGKELRKDYFKREERLKEISNCFGCELLQFRAYYIEKLLENLNLTIDV